ncbi:hypothetical protein PENTCL1PPCAC_770 [Pristionchus entomophagus]|uniref:Uncharacterized protein n=1 Tax=Pristionchus entomophagus TaxID=358040 RepID=A0AAV5S905_9BILA|nr:hypothetical protein PENTCL1PPCAC_770 [Pristionchus entomophagus]
MRGSALLAACQVLLALCEVLVSAQSHDELYILIDEVSVFNCKGVRNEIKITEDDIDIVNERGNKVYYIRAPGNYTIDFRKITVKENFGHLAGEIGITLQVPIIEGPAGIRFDLPYTMVPETTLLSQKCDAHSGIVERNGKQYCRYCDLCGISNAVEGELNKSGHQFLMGGEEETTVQPACGGIERSSYNFKRTISLPSRSTLEGMIKDKVQGVDGEIKKRLNKGRGRFQVFLNLISAEKPPITQHRWFAQSRECACCLNPRSRECSSLSFLYCNIEECKSAWAQMCLHNTARIVACYTVEFNYRMTTSYAEVQQFLNEKGLSDPNQQQHLTRKVIAPSRVGGQQPRYIPSSSSSVFNQPTVLSAQQQLREVQQSRYPHQRQQPAAQSVDDQRSAVRQEEEGSLSDRCVALMPARLQHLRRYCTIFWNAKLCCSHCAGIC